MVLITKMKVSRALVWRLGLVLAGLVLATPALLSTPPTGARLELGSTSPIGAMSWSPDGSRLVYIAGNELREWPGGRRLMLPEEVQGDEDFPPLQWMIKWRPDGRQFAIIYRK